MLPPAAKARRPEGSCSMASLPSAEGVAASPLGTGDGVRTAIVETLGTGAARGVAAAGAQPPPAPIGLAQGQRTEAERNRCAFFNPSTKPGHATSTALFEDQEVGQR